LWEFTYA
jgi:hypothetical protein